MPSISKSSKQPDSIEFSIGMQSAVPSVLATLERSHKPENVALAIAGAKAAGLNTSLDLIYGAPGETLEQWQTSIQEAISLNPDHISAYALIVEDGTKLSRQIKSGELDEPDEDLQADKYELADKLLAENGFDWYEVSNWSKGKTKFICTQLFRIGNPRTGGAMALEHIVTLAESAGGTSSTQQRIRASFKK